MRKNTLFLGILLAAQAAFGAIQHGNQQIKGNLSVTGTQSFTGATTGTQLNVDNLRLDGNTISTTNTNGSMVFDANGTGVFTFNDAIASPTITTPAINGANLNFGTASNTNRLLLPKDTTSNLDALTDTQAALAFDTSTGKPVYNNGAGWVEVGSGAGGGGAGINMLTGYNHNAELGATTNWSETGGGTLSTTNTAADVANGTYAFSYDASTSGDYVESDLITIPAGLYGANCLLESYYKGFDSNITAQVHDGTNVVASQAIVAATGYRKLQINFVCPSSGGLKMRLYASGNAAIGYWDEVHLGSASNISNVSQAYKVGSIKWAGASNCAWTTSSTSFGNYSADTDCSAPTVTGNVSAPGTKIPAAVVSNLGPGTVMLVASGGFYKAGTVDAAVQFRFSDGTTNSTPVQVYSGTNPGPATTVIGSFEYTTAPSNPTTFNIQGRTGSASNAANIAADVSAVTELQVDIYFFPSSSQNAVNNEPNFDTTGMLVPYGISTCPNGTLAADGSAVSRSTYAALFNKIGTTFGSGDGSTTFNLPNTGGIFLRGIGSQTIGGVTTPTITLGGAQADALQGHRHQIRVPATGGGSSLWGFQFWSASRSTTLSESASVGEDAISGVLLTDGTNGSPRSTSETRPANIGVKYCIVTNGQRPMPVLVGSVTSNSTGAERVERAYVVNNGTASINSQSGSWLTGCTRNSIGAVTCNIASGTFSALPVCAITPAVAGTIGDQVSVRLATQSTTSFQTYTTLRAAAGGSAAGGGDYDFNVICMGPR